MSAVQEIAIGVSRVPLSMVNAYLLDSPEGGFVLVDSGMSGSFPRLREAMDELYGSGASPLAVVLTHGHGDHVGGLKSLDPDVPIYAHPDEIPYLTGQAEYPKPDPRTGGLMARVMSLVRMPSPDLGARVRALPADGTLPHLPDWRWLATPGHTPGHVSLHRASDGVLVAGDVLRTMASMLPVPPRPPQVKAPGPALTPDPEAQAQSQRTLAALEPDVLAAGHGTPMYGPEMRQQLRDLAEGTVAAQAGPSRGRSLAFLLAAFGLFFLIGRRRRRG